MSIEVWSGKYVVDQTPMIVRTSAEENWHLDTARLLRHGGPAYPQKKQANKDLIGYGPYLSRLPSGDLVAFQWFIPGPTVELAVCRGCPGRQFRVCHDGL